MLFTKLINYHGNHLLFVQNCFDLKKLSYIIYNEIISQTAARLKAFIMAAEEKVRKIPLYPGFPELARSDVSIHPSYTKLSLAYRVICRHRYHWAKVAQRKQFMSELHSFERLQSNALDGVRVHREFSQGILSHKIPPRRYIQKLTPDPLNKKERMRVEEIISGRLDFSKK